MTKSRKLDGEMSASPTSRSRALTARVPRWQSARYAHLAMIGAIIGLGLVLPGSAALARAARGGLDGPIGTLHRGAYLCEEAGNALGEAGVHQPAEDFSILHDSIYETPTGRGSYLLTGKLVVMTSGPKRGERFHRLSDSYLRRLAADGSEDTLRCIRTVLNNAR